MKGMEQVPNPGERNEGESVNERADLYVKDLLDKFTVHNLERLRRGEHGLVEQDLIALANDVIGALVQTEGKEFAYAVSRRIVDEIEFCSTAFAEYVDEVKNAVTETEAKYGLGESSAEVGSEETA